MQFKHPEILWALFLLLIPILIHLFQLRRFKKTPFTNVAMLQKVVSESRKSNTLKKWLLLFTRLLLMACLVFAFAQPFSASTRALQEKENVIYLDDSFSMQAKANGITLLEKSVQDLIKSIDSKQIFSLFTNERTFKNITLKDIQNTLLSLSYTHKQLTLDEIQLKGNTLFSKSSTTRKNLILASDFQQRLDPSSISIDSSLISHFVSLQPKESGNVSIDSTYISSNLSDQIVLTTLLSGGNIEAALPISLYNGDTLIAKSSAKFNADGNSSVAFSIPANKEIKGRLQVADASLSFDNLFYFNINKKERINVLAIGDRDAGYLSRLYTPEEFDLKQTTLNQLDYSAIDQQNVVLLNGLEVIPNSLQQVLLTFKENGGTLIIIPAVESDIASYNQFLSGFFATKFLEQSRSDLNITTISFDHPLYENVFEKKVYNFQYPSVKQYFKITTRAPRILSLEGNDSFLVGNNGFYLFTAALNGENSNFKNSPLIVPTLYNMAVFSLRTSELYHLIGVNKAVDIAIQLESDNILSISQEESSFIPLQHIFTNKVRLQFDEEPSLAGIYDVTHENQFLKNISFNYPREESQLNYMDLSIFPDIKVQNSIPELFDQLQSEDTITAYWKWFVILALLLALIEVIIQKFVT